LNKKNSKAYIYYAVLLEIENLIIFMNDPAKKDIRNLFDTSYNILNDLKLSNKSLMFRNTIITYDSLCLGKIKSE